MANNFDINKEMGSFANGNGGFPFDAVAASDVTTASPKIVTSTTAAAAAATTTTMFSTSSSADVVDRTTTTLTEAWDAALTTEAGATTVASPAKDFKEIFNELLANAQSCAKGGCCCRSQCLNRIIHFLSRI